MDTDDSVADKRRKSDTNDASDTEENRVSAETEISEDTDSFLQDFLNKRPPNNLSLFQRAIQDEEMEAKKRDPAEDLKLYQDAAADLSDCLADIAELKATKPEGWKEGINDIRKEGAFITLIMKKLNRVEKTRTKLTREKVNKEKIKVDAARIKLDNMLSEIQHLRKEVDKCLKFRSRPLGIELVPVNEFYDKAPSSISKPEITKNNDHLLQLARLEWELKQRKELSALLSDLEDKRSSIKEQIEKREKDISSIGPLVNDVLAFAQPLKEKLGSTSTKSSKITDQAYLLPDPLCFLYLQANAYREVSDKDISLEIKGDFAEAQKFKSESSDDSREVKKNEASKDKMSIEQEKNKLLTKHPLSVNLKFNLKDGFLFELQFIYYVNLNLATVKPSTSTPSNAKLPSSASSEALLNPKYILHNLFSGDSGLESPNLMNYYQMQKVDLDSLPLEKMGLPYVWVQKLVGLNFIGQVYNISPKEDVCRSNLPLIIKELKRRCLYRVSLLSLVYELEQGDIISPTGMKQLKISSQLSYLKGIKWAEYCEHPASESNQNSPVVSPSDSCFKALITRGDAKLSCLIAVKPDYPLSPSIFSVKIDYEPLAGNLAKKYGLEIEKEVNVYWKDLLSSRTQAIFSLSYQLFKTMLCFDVLLEVLYPQDFPSNKTFPSKFRGKTRALPLHYSPEGNQFIHRK